jgi:exodeoxyribonuclease V alpha subunit
MATHITLRLAWHNDGWNGHICKNPKANTYCIGNYSYPGDMIKTKRDLEWEEQEKVKGISCSKLDRSPACALSINAFGNEHLKALSEPPEWFNDESSGVYIDLPQSTVCVWPYEVMYGEDVRNKLGKQVYDYEQRLENAKSYFEELEKGQSLIFYYSNYSNPFSEEESRKYVVVGISRFKRTGDIHYYKNVSEKNQEKYAGGFVWQMPVTSYYPDQGFRIPYHKYKDNPEILNKLLFIPENPRNFKYATRQLTDDDALSYIERFLEIVKTLIEIGDDSENWEIRKQWLLGLLNELWKKRGAYPGLISVLSYLNFSEGIDYYKRKSEEGEDKFAYLQIKNLITGKTKAVEGIELDPKVLKDLQRNWKIRNENEQKLLIDILPRFDLSIIHIENILSEKRQENNIYSSLDEIIINPYSLSEEYIGDDIDDYITFNKIDHGVLPSPELGIEELFAKNEAERFRALCVDQLKFSSVHTFISSNSVLESINHRLSYLPDWKKEEFTQKYFEVDEEVIGKKIWVKNYNETKYLYLKNIYEDERKIQKILEELSNRPDIPIKKPVTEKTFIELLRDKESDLAIKAEKEYEKALVGQAKVCQRVFNKPISVISGPAGTGKTTIIKTIISAIRKAHGSAASVYLLAPTGKASERMKEKTGSKATTIHSFLASNSWLNNNFTFKRIGGKLADEITNLVIDECSMIDLELFATLFRSINWNSIQRLILVGDPNQLPPIGRGRLFYEIIEWLQNNHPENLGTLSINVRQLENRVLNRGNGILELADIFIQEKQKDENFNKHQKEEMVKRLQEGEDLDEDLRVIYWTDTDDLEAKIKEQIISDLETDAGQKVVDNKIYELWNKLCNTRGDNLKATYQQVISPFRGEYDGVDNLNIIFQNMFNAYQAGKNDIEGIALFDKVIQIRNRPKSNMISAYNCTTKKPEYIEIYNGEIGFVKPHGFDHSKFNNKYFRLEKFQVKFERKENYWVGYGKGLGKNEKDRWIKEENPEDNLELGYVISVHKAQGSEFERVYCVLPKRKSQILSMELLYTAITRAKRHLTIFAQGDVSTFLSLCRPESSVLKRINSSLFSFEPLPEEVLSLSRWYEEGKIHSTLTAYFVRSKSEMNIANILHLKDIPFEYETPLFAPDGTMYLPDFTLKIKGETHYWEHAGMLNNPDYKKHWEEKEKWYNKYFPKQLIATYESNLQSKEIEKILSERFGL